MIFDILSNPMIWWLAFAYTVGTLFGRWMSFRNHVHTITEATIDSLIKDGYLKTRGAGKNMEILKHEEWCKQDVDI